MTAISQRGYEIDQEVMGAYQMRGDIKDQTLCNSDC